MAHQSPAEIELTTALRERSADKVKALFRADLIELQTGKGYDYRDAILWFILPIDCTRRIGLDPIAVLRPLLSGSPPWIVENFDGLVGIPDPDLASYGYELRWEPSGPAYWSFDPDEKSARLKAMLDGLDARPSDIHQR